MTNTIKKTDVKEVNPIVAAVSGAVIAGVAVAGAFVLSNKSNQDKIKKVVTNVKADAETQKEKIVDKAGKLQEIAKNTVNDVKNL